jgi:hypothetical protein
MGERLDDRHKAKQQAEVWCVVSRGKGTVREMER